MRPTSRRQFIGTLAAALPALGVARSALGLPFDRRALNFVHTHTGERLAVEYFADGSYIADALTDVNHFLRDFRTGEVHVIDPELLDLLATVTRLTGSTRPFQVISGYRTPATNAMLQHTTEGVASNSLHMQGQAIDIRLADVPLAKLRGAALTAHRGGVGYYPASEFVHLDTGRVRTW